MKSLKHKLNSLLSWEFWTVLIVTVIILFISRMEAKLIELSAILSESKEFFSTLAYFALINLNVVFILLLSFLIFKNVTKLIIERKRGVIGSKLKTKLVFSLVFFALSPTLLLFYVSAKFITTSFDTWFSKKVQLTMEQTRDISSMIYEQDKKRLMSLALLARQKLKWSTSHHAFYIPEPKVLHGFHQDYGLTGLSLFTTQGQVYWSEGSALKLSNHGLIQLIENAKVYFYMSHSDQGLGTVINQDAEDIVIGIAPIRYPDTGILFGFVLSEMKFNTQILKSLEKIIHEFSQLRPGAQLIQASYLVLMVFIVCLIVFFAIWMGFFVAKRVTGPLQSLAEASREIALGNYNIYLSHASSDEIGQLIASFNHMAQDLQTHQTKVEQGRLSLERSNIELEQRRRLMAEILSNIHAGVISLDQHFRVTLINPAAMVLLGIHTDDLLGKVLSEVKEYDPLKKFWNSVQEAIVDHHKKDVRIDLGEGDTHKALMVHIQSIMGDIQSKKHMMGYVLVFEDINEKLKMQRVFAWQEVAQRLAHEIKNPITPIKLNAERLLRKYKNNFSKEDDKYVFEKCLTGVIHHADSLRDLVDEFSKFGRFPDTKKQTQDLLDIVQNTIHFFQESYPQIRFVLSSTSDVPGLFLDPEQMHRVFVNILNNAIGALDASRQGVIKASVMYAPIQNAIEIYIEDNGVGVPEHLTSKVFEAYFSTKKEGSGLGLSIVSKIIEAHHGSIQIKPLQPFGSMVAIVLPLQQKII